MVGATLFRCLQRGPTITRGVQRPNVVGHFTGRTLVYLLTMGTLTSGTFHAQGVAVQLGVRYARKFGLAYNGLFFGLNGGVKVVFFGHFVGV